MISDPDFSHDGRFLSCSHNGVRIWRMRDGFSKVLKDKNKTIFVCVKFNPDGQHIAAGTYGGMLVMWNVRTSQLVAKWTAHETMVRSVVFTLDGKGLVSGGSDDAWKYWDISLSELNEPGCGMAKDSMVGRKSKVTVHTVRHMFLYNYSFLILCPSVYRTVPVLLPSLLIVDGLFLGQLVTLCISGICAMAPCSAH